MHHERVPSQEPEAFQCHGCRYDLSKVVPEGNAVLCPECGKALSTAYLGTVPNSRPIGQLLRVFCGPTAVSAVFFYAFSAAGSMKGHNISAVMVFATGVLVPPLAAPFLFRGRLDRATRRRGTWKAVVAGWSANAVIALAMLFATFLL